MRHWVLITAVFLGASIVSGCSDPPLTEPEKRSPDPVNVYDDAEQSQVVEDTPIPTLSASGLQAQFECVAGVANATLDMNSESADRPDDNGQPMTVRVYDPAGTKVFGFPATVLETFTHADGTSGIAVYVAPSLATVLPAIIARFPESSSRDRMHVTGPGMAGTITLREATLGDATVTRIECTSAS